MKVLVKHVALAFLIGLIFLPDLSEAFCNYNGYIYNLAVDGPTIVLADESADYTLNLTYRADTWAADGANCSWSNSDGFIDPANSQVNPITMTAGSIPSSAEGDQSVTCKWRNINDCTASLNVTIIGVGSLQYEEPGGSWTGISGTLYVLRGSTVTFKAIPEPDVDWPTDKPEWGGSSGAGGTGGSVTVTFNTLSTSLTDYKTVTATCGNTKTANVIVYDLTGTLIPDVNFNNRNTDRYGVEETVSLSHTTNPSGITGLPLRWTKSSGRGSVTGSTYDAEAIPGSVTLRLEVTSGPSRGQGHDYVKTVVAPVNRFVRHPALTGTWHTQGNHSVKFKGQSYLDPKDVSFTNIKRREGASTAATGTGLFLFANGYIHPVGSWFTPSNPNITTGCSVVADTTGFDLGAGGTLGDTGLMSNYFIDYEYVGDDGVVRNMGNIESSKKVEANGDSMARKGSVGWVSKNLNDASSSF